MIRHRAYRDDDDYFKMRRFLQSAWKVTGSAGGMFHVGDITWQRFMYTRETFRPEERIALWERPDGELSGFAWYYPKWTEVAFQIDPGLRGSDEWRTIAGSMLRWAEKRHTEDTDAVAPLSIAEFVSDVAFADFIRARGFARSDTPMMRFHRQSLTKPIPEPGLAEGFSVRQMLGEDEYEDRVQSHREVWNPSKFTVEGYRQLRSSPGYDPQLDLVIVAPDGKIAANTICWHDEVNRSGEFEPVGTREAYRGHGLAKALLYEGMRRLQERGCEIAYVSTTEDREAACRLYLSAGFEIVDRWVYYQR